VTPEDRDFLRRYLWDSMSTETHLMIEVGELADQGVCRDPGGL
jgi:hypothetical protein